jgi:chemotaxis protein CheD
MSSATVRNAAAPAVNAWHGSGKDGIATFQYFERQFGLPGIKLLPGEYYVSSENNVLVTVLGSCVAACLRDPIAGVGGMNHFMLPDTDGDLVSSSARYGSFAMEILVNELLKRGARRCNLEAKVFGGGNVLRSFTATNVGSRNVQFVRQYLAAERIAIAAEDLLDVCPRKVYYFPKTGKVLVRRLPAMQASADLADETAYSSRLRAVPVAGDVELFD